MRTTLATLSLLLAACGGIADATPDSGTDTLQADAEPICCTQWSRTVSGGPDPHWTLECVERDPLRPCLAIEPNAPELP
jgi:hypothetical protein